MTEFDVLGSFLQ